MGIRFCGSHGGVLRGPPPLDIREESFRPCVAINKLLTGIFGAYMQKFGGNL